MAVPASRAVTAEELFALPDDDCRRELVDGVIVTMTRPARRTASSPPGSAIFSTST